MTQNNSPTQNERPLRTDEDSCYLWWDPLEITQREADVIAYQASAANLTPSQYIVHACAVARAIVTSKALDDIISAKGKL